MTIKRIQLGARVVGMTALCIVVYFEAGWATALSIWLIGAGLEMVIARGILL